MNPSLDDLRRLATLGNQSSAAGGQNEPITTTQLIELLRSQQRLQPSRIGTQYPAPPQQTGAGAAQSHPMASAVLDSPDYLSALSLVSRQQRQQGFSPGSPLPLPHSAPDRHGVQALLAATTNHNHLVRLIAQERLANLMRGDVGETLRLLQQQQHRQEAASTLSFLSTRPMLPVPGAAAAQNTSTQAERVHAAIYQQQAGMLPANNPPTFLAGQLSTEGSCKRKAEYAECLKDDPKKKKTLSVSDNSFFLPSRKQALKPTFKLLSYHSLWEELEDSELQEEIFRRRIVAGIKIRGASRSVKRTIGRES